MSKAGTTETVPPSDFLDRLIGSWSGRGQVYGMDARLQMKWEWILGNQFARVTFRNEMTNQSGGTQVFEAHAYYKPVGKGYYQGSWFDSQGDVHPIKADVEGETLSVLWGISVAKCGHTAYHFLDGGKVEVIDSIRLKNDGWKEISRSIFQPDEPVNAR
jgi:hypothetical protein